MSNDISPYKQTPKLPIPVQQLSKYTTPVTLNRKRAVFTTKLEYEEWQTKTFKYWATIFHHYKPNLERKVFIKCGINYSFGALETHKQKRDKTKQQKLIANLKKSSEQLSRKVAKTQTYAAALQVGLTKKNEELPAEIFAITKNKIDNLLGTIRNKIVASITKRITLAEFDDIVKDNQIELPTIKKEAKIVHKPLVRRPIQKRQRNLLRQALNQRFNLQIPIIHGKSLHSALNDYYQRAGGKLLFNDYRLSHAGLVKALNENRSELPVLNLTPLSHGQ